MLYGGRTFYKKTNILKTISETARTGFFLNQTWPKNTDYLDFLKWIGQAGLIDSCNRKEQAAVLFASVEEIHTLIVTSTARIKAGNHNIRVHLLLTDRYGHLVSSLAAQTSVSTHSEDFPCLQRFKAIKPSSPINCVFLERSNTFGEQHIFR